jgi:S-DNA-T family DNA segregation ATPase FtsK/SpoIIIE
MHLVLATQRPSGAVSDDIRANTDLRIALRVQDAGESTDVVDVADAAHLPRHRPGRACIRLGPGEVVTVQTALATAAPAERRARVRLRPFTFAAAEPAAAGAQGASGPTDLDRLVDACAAAWSATGRPLPRRPWPDPLPAVVDRSTLPPGATALADHPDGQCHVPVGWDPGGGNLAIYGVGGSGTTTTLLAVACSLAETAGPDRLHLYAVDHGAGELAVLAGLPHTGAVIAAGERERQARLVRRLRAELDHRRAGTAGEPSVVVLVDGIAAFLAQFDDVAGIEVLDAFERVFADGPEVGIHVALTAARPGALPAALASLVRQRWVHRLADPLDVAAAGVPGRLPALVAGRFVDLVSGLVAHTGTTPAGWAAAVEASAARWRGTPAGAAPVGELPATLVRAPGRPFGDRPWRLEVGVADDDLGPAALTLWDGEHVLVAGPPRAGRTTALATIAAAAVDGGARVAVLGGRSSWLPSVEGVEPTTVPDLAELDGPAFVLVDDAEAVDDPDGVLEALVSGSAPGVHVVAGGRAEVLRGLYSHWTRTLRRSRAGLLLRPHLDLDGELLATPLPRRVGVPLVAGRGFLVADGAARLVQVALPG